MTALTLKPEQAAAAPSAMLPAAILLATVFAHWAVWALPSPDVTQFLSHWYRHIAETGLVEAFSEPFGNYSPTYLYLLGLLTLSEDWVSVHDGVKLLSVAGSILLGLSVLRLLQVLEVPQGGLRSLWTPLLPSVFANAAMLSQCDALWVAPCLMAVAASLERRHAAMLAWAGLAFAVKGQAAFLAPFLFAVLIARRVPLYFWLIPPAVAGLIMVPALLAGWPPLNIFLKYVEQGGQQPSFVSNAPNIWAPPAVFAPELGRAMVPAGFLVAALLSLGLAWWLRSRLGDPVTLLRAALFSALFVPTMLPKMHERYFLLADLLAFVLALVCRNRQSVIVAILTMLGSTLAIAGYVAQAPLVSVLSALPMTIALIMTGWALRNAHPLDVTEVPTPGRT